MSVLGSELFQSPRAFVAHYIRQRSSEFLALSFAVMLAAACAVAVQYQLKQLVDAMTASGSSDFRAVRSALYAFIALMGVESLAWRSCAWLSCRATVEVGVQMRLDLFDYLSGQSIRYFADNLAGSLGQRITGTAGNFGALSNTVTWRVLPPIVDFFGALLIFSLIDWPMAIVLAVFVAGATAALIAAGRKGGPIHTRYFSRASRAAGNVIDVISNMWAVKAFSARRREWERLASEFRSEADAQRQSWMYIERTRIAYDLVLWTMSSCMALWAVRNWSAHKITPGDVVIITALTFRILHGSREVALALVDVSQQFGYITDTLQALGQVHAISDSRLAQHRPPMPGKIEFRHVTFGYDPDDPVLRDVSLEIRAGQKVGIVGVSGAGKTTMIQLLQRLYDVQSGLISINGVPLAMFSQDSLRSMLAVVPQEVGLFHRSVLDNIRFARPDATDSEIYSAACAARCESFVRRLPAGYHTIVGEHGAKLSGGQRQRIGIARAFLKDAPILILDEATSALDTATEIEIQESIARLAASRTVVAVAHRLSTLAAFDRILVIQDGQVVEDGAPDALSRHGAVFKSMWRLQSGSENFAAGNLGRIAR